MTASQTYQQRRAARLDDPSMEKLRTPGARRWLAAGLILVLVVEAVLIAAAALLPIAVFVGGMVLLMIAMVFTLGGLKASTRGVEELSPDVLDERQAQVRGLVYSLSYRVLSVVFVVTVVLMLLAQGPWWAAPFEVMVIIPVISWQLIITIPTFVTALRMKV
jgi:membrane protein YdbS with pleckstrin-like domain